MPIWIFNILRKNWKVLLIVLGCVVGYFYFQKHNDGWTSKYDQLQLSSQTQIKEIEQAREAEKIQNQENLKKLKLELENVQHQYDEQKKLLESRKRSIVKKIVDESGTHPGDLAKQLSDVTGFRVKGVGDP